MKNSQKIKYNLIVGLGSQLVTILLGIVIPRLTLVNYGSEVNGLLNSITQIYSYIGLLEAGIGTATIQALYRTVGSEDHSRTNAILAATNRYYNRTGILYTAAIFAFSLIYPIVVASEIPPVTVVLIILFNGAGSVIGFFVQRKYLLLLQAEGKNYIESTLTMILNVLRNVAKILLMAMGMDVVLVQAAAMLLSLVQMAYISWYIRKNYAWIDLTVEPDYESISQSKNVLVHQLSSLIFNNTDSIILTVFCGLKVVSVYSLYTMLFSMISNAMSVFSNSIVFSLGQAYHEDRKRFLRMYDLYEICYMAVVFSLYAVTERFILPFVTCYTAGITDTNYLDPLLPLLMISTYLLSCGRIPSAQLVTIAGHFQKTQNRSILESVINLAVSLLAVQRWGIYGVLVGTIAALLYRANDLVIYANREILDRSPWDTYKRWIVNLLVFVVWSRIGRLPGIGLDSYGAIFLMCVPYTICTFCVFAAAALLSNAQARNELKQLFPALMKKWR